MANSGVGEHGGGEPDAAGIRCQLDSVRAGSASEIQWLHTLLLRASPVRVLLDARRHGRRAVAHPTVTGEESIREIRPPRRACSCHRYECFSLVCLILELPKEIFIFLKNNIKWLFFIFPNCTKLIELKY